MKYRIWWIPQIEYECTFYVPVNSPEEGLKMMSILGAYDLFQLKNNIKPDFSNTGGLEVFEDGEWVDYYDEDGRDIDEHFEEDMNMQDFIEKIYNF